MKKISQYAKFNPYSNKHCGSIFIRPHTLLSISVSMVKKYITSLHIFASLGKRNSSNIPPLLGKEPA